MRIVILGSGSPRPDLTRSQPSVYLEENGFSCLIDCGDGTVQQLLRHGVDIAQVTAILFTHLHSDHTLGYGQFLLGGWSLGRRTLAVFGPPATQSFHQAWLDTLYAPDVSYRLAIGRTGRGLTEDVVIREAQGHGQFTLGPFRITHLPVVHSIATFAYRIESEDGDIAVISGDTAYYEPLADMARGSHLLIHEACLAPTPLYDPGLDKPGEVSWRELTRYHSTPEEAGRIARQAGVAQLILTHFLPHVDVTATITRCRESYAGPLAVAEDFLEWRNDGPRGELPG